MPLTALIMDVLLSPWGDVLPPVPREKSYRGVCRVEFTEADLAQVQNWPAVITPRSCFTDESLLKAGQYKRKCQLSVKPLAGQSGQLLFI